MKPEKKRSFWERYALKKLTVRENAQDDEDLYQLTDQEIQLLKSIRLNTYIKAGLAGILGVVLLYIPYYIWKETLFPERMFNILFINQPISLEIEFLIFSLILVILEIWYLTYINIQAVDQISKVCGSPNPNDPDFHKHIEDLIQIGLDKKKNELKKLGINPYDGLSKWG